MLSQLNGFHILKSLFLLERFSRCHFGSDCWGEHKSISPVVLSKKSYFEHRIAPFVIQYLGDSLSLIRLFNIVDNQSNNYMILSRSLDS